MTLSPHQHAMIDYCRIAFNSGASDIHLEPQKSGIRIRLRIDGNLKRFVHIRQEDAETFAEHIKELLRFNMTLAGVPQDASYSHPTEMVDFRCNLTPVKYGEKIVMRLLQRGKDFHLDRYPLYEGPKRDLLNFITKSQGIILVSGPTGSGKSTLLYSALGTLDRETMNIHTIEDPIEYEIEGLNQTEINQKKDLTFARCLRALMRQDPDVIMIGEIRDKETAEAAMHAAATGHLVFTTVHANDAHGIVTRLQGYGVLKEHLDSALLFASAQRLPKTLCKECRVDAPEHLDLLKALFPQENIDFMPKKSEGCNECGGLGIKGRKLMFEYIKRNEQITDRNAFEMAGNLRSSALDLVRRGEVSVPEAHRQFI
jgi:type II secretory ATPase GspE/PulE/Tfp pilus assembly ATPase PilB-like protein